MARRFTIELLMDLASQIGANPAKALSRSNISFLGKGPTTESLVPAPFARISERNRSESWKT